MERAAIIVAGGSGVRMGSGVPKQFLPLGGKPVVVRAVERFAGLVDRILVVLPPGAPAMEWPVEVDICTGGATRFESVRNAVRMLCGECLVAIHDGVRPLVGREMIAKAFDEAGEHGSAVPVTKPSDSFRLDGAVVDRARLTAVQTPQVFRLDLLAEAYSRPDTGFTDDASLVESLGHRLHFVAGDPANIKITTPADLVIADALWTYGSDTGSTAPHGGSR